MESPDTGQLNLSPNLSVPAANHDEAWKPMNHPCADLEIFREKRVSPDQETTLRQLRQRIEELKQERDEYRQQAEKEAARRHYLESAFHQIPDALVTLDASGRVFDWNFGAQRMFGYSKNEALGTDLDALISAQAPDEDAGTQKHKPLSRHTLKAAEGVRYRKDNTPVRVLISSAPIILEGTFQGVVTTYTDISEQKRAEEKLRTREKGCRELSEKAPVGIYQADSEKKPWFMNREMAKILGASSPKEAIQSYGDFGSDLHADNSRRKELIKRLRRDGEVRNFEFRAKHLSGKRIWLSLNARIRRWLSPSSFLVDAFAVDITERKRSEKALIEKYRERSMLLDAVPAQIWFHTDVNTYGAANRAHAEFLGHSPAELKNRSLEEFLSEENAAICKKDNIEIFESGEQIHTEEWIRNSLGEKRFLSLSKVPRLDAKNNVERIVCIASDITERKQLEERLKETNFHDPSTGLYNRAFFEEEMHRLGKDRFCPIGIIVCCFEGQGTGKTSSPRSGKGEEIAAAAASVLRRCFRSSDIVARIGTNTFAVLLAQVNRDILHKCSRFIHSEIESYNRRDSAIELSAWTGSAVRYNPPVDMNDLLQRAEQSAQEAKLGQSPGHSGKKDTEYFLLKTQMARDFFSKDPGEGSRLQEYTVALGQVMGLSRARLDNLRLLARFHDLGKVGVPDRVLFKSGRLSHEEFQAMKRHSEIGHRIALSSSSLADIADLILKHHEWWDGRGYPLGLQGKTIPLECRILSITEAYEAMTSDRPYRDAMSGREAIVELRRYAGRQFDPELVERFIRCVREEDHED